MHGLSHSSAQSVPHADASNLHWALYYASRGWRVLPLHSVEGGCCTCGDATCRSPGKHPRTPHGVKDASINPRQIHLWWKWWPTANVGIATGVPSGIVVFDIDPRNGGDVSDEQLRKEFPAAFAELLEVRTGSGGAHLYFECRSPTPSRANIRPGIDVKADGGYVVAPPSLHISGSRYRFVSNSGLIPPPLPAALHDLILPKAQAQGGGDASRTHELDSLRVSDAIKNLVREGKPRGRRSEAMFGAIRATIKAGHSDEEIIAVLMDPANGLSEKPREKGEPWLRSELKRAREKPDRDGPAVQGDGGRKPRLLVEACNPDRTVSAQRDILAAAGKLFDRGVPVRLAFDQMQRGTVAQVMTPDALMLMAHAVCRPYVLKKKDGALYEADAPLPRSVAAMYLDWRGEWRLPPLNGVATAPLLHTDGTIRSAAGYDPASGMWCENLPDLTGLVPEQPTKDEAAAAFRLIRKTFKTFCFADAETIDDAGGLPVVHLSKPPGGDESSFLVALGTAVCRPSLHLAPGVLLRAAPLSGAGAGKGLLARCISIIAFGREPHAVTAGATAEELEKRISAELIEASPVLFLDNLNNTAFKSNLLASAMTERPARVRVLGKSQMVPLNATAFVILTGNGLSVSEDLARRFIPVNLDPRTEDPEARPFPNDIRAEVTARRTELLAAVLTIWRWGRIATDIPPGLPLGSFEQWCRWVRDPLLALGCLDPVARVSEAKERDGERRWVADLFAVWWGKHQDRPVAAANLHDEVNNVIDPQRRGRQFVVSRLVNLEGTRAAGFILSRQAPAGKWGHATYALKQAP